jgi:branched-chain amino acid transport system ATP-binding protein
MFGRIAFLGQDVTTVWADERVKMGLVLSRERHPVFVESDVEENLKIASYLLPRGEKKGMISYVYEVFPPSCI